jgi:hypothetical protein
MPAAWAFGAAAAFRASMIGWSRLVQIVTVEPFTAPVAEPDDESSDPELRQAEVVRAATPTAATDMSKEGRRISWLLCLDER